MSVTPALCTHRVLGEVVVELFEQVVEGVRCNQQRIDGILRQTTAQLSVTAAALLVTYLWPRLPCAVNFQAIIEPQPTVG